MSRGLEAEKWELQVENALINFSFCSENVNITEDLVYTPGKVAELHEFHPQQRDWRTGREPGNNIVLVRRTVSSNIWSAWVPRPCGNVGSFVSFGQPVTIVPCFTPWDVQLLVKNFPVLRQEPYPRSECWVRLWWSLISWSDMACLDHVSHLHGWKDHLRES